jgi:flavodoxin I
LRTALQSYRKKGIRIPSGLEECLHWKAVDSPELATLKDSELKAHSEKIKAELEEQLRKAEAEQKAREEAAKKAAEEAAKAAAAKLAAAAAKPVAGAVVAAGPVDRSQPTLSSGKVLVVYGSSTGNTKNVAEAIKTEMGSSVDHCKNITEIHPADLAQFEKVIVGVPTWHIGEIQEDWGAVLPEIEALSFQGKKVAVFGLGDGKGYPDTYVDAMAELVEKFEKKGAQLVGLWPTDGYDFKKSKAIRDGKFLGLVIDVENQDHLSDKRVKAWVALLQKELLS